MDKSRWSLGIIGSFVVLVNVGSVCRVPYRTATRKYRRNMETECIHGLEQAWCALCKRPLPPTPHDRVDISIRMGDRSSAYRIDSTGTKLPNGAEVFEILGDQEFCATVSHCRHEGPLLLVAKAMHVLHSPHQNPTLAIVNLDSDD